MLAIFYLGYLALCLIIFKGLWHSDWPLLDTLCTVIAMTLPLVGFVLAVWWRARYRPADATALMKAHLADRFEPVVNYSAMRRQAKEDLQAEALKPALGVPRAGGHTDIIVQLHQQPVRTAGTILQTAMNSGHVDTVHYAATTWLNQRKRLVSQLQEAELAYARSGSKKNAIAIIAAYQTLLDSNLLDEDGVRRYQRQLVTRAGELASAHSGTWQLWAALGHAQLLLDDHAAATATWRQAQTECAANAPLTYLRLAIAYAARDWRQVSAALKTLSTQSLLDLTAAQQETLTILRRGADETG